MRRFRVTTSRRIAKRASRVADSRSRCERACVARRCMAVAAWIASKVSAWFATSSRIKRGSLAAVGSDWMARPAEKSAPDSPRPPPRPPPRPRPRPRRAGAAASARVGTAREARLGATLPRGGAEGLANAAKAVRACAMGRDATRLLDKPPSLRGDDDDAFRVGGWRDYACDARAGVRSANALQRAAVLSAFGGTSRRGRGARGYASAAGATRCAVPSPHPPRKAAGKASRKARENGRIVGSGARKNSSGVRCVKRDR